MAGSVSDEAFARVLNQMGIATLDQIEAAKAIQAENATKGVLLTLPTVLIQQGIITPAIQENVEKKLQAQQAGGVQVLGQYKLLKKLGEGGMGAVYLAEDTVSQRQVALKVLPKKHVSDPGFLTRFRREAKAAGALNHVNIVGAHTVGEEMGHHFIVMEYCEGETLDRILKRDQVLPWDKAVQIVVQVARGLQHAHEHGFVHRDIKPGNIILAPDGTAKILDLGLSKNIGSGEQSFNTQTGVALGTPHYISPEQARGDKSIDGRTDIYSLGATFYHLVTGQTPFEGSTAAVIMTKHLNEQLTNPQDLVEDLPDSVAHVIVKMMAKGPNDRYRDCKELLDDLELVIDGKDPSSHAIDVGKSSVAVPRVAHPRRPAGIAQGARRTAGRESPVGTRQHVPVAHNADGTAEQARSGAPVGKYIAIGVAALVALVFILVLSMGGNRDRGEREAQAATEKQKTDEAARLAEEKRKAEEARVKGEAARLEEERRKLAEDKRKTEEAKLEEEKQKLAEERRKLEEARLAVVAEAKKEAETATTKVEPTPVQPDTKVAQPDTKASETPAVQIAADARTAKAQQLFSAVVKEAAPLLVQNKFADAIALLERKAKDPALADAVELLKQEQADVEAVAELRRSAIEALRNQVGQQVTLRKGGTAFKGKVVNEPKSEAVTLDMGGAQMTFSATMLSLEDVDQYAPKEGNVGADLRQRGILYLAAGNVAKAKEYFTKPQTLNPEPYLDRITALELGEIEAAGLSAWNKAEALFSRKAMKEAKDAYDAFTKQHGQTKTAAGKTALLQERYDAIEAVIGPAKEVMLDLGGVKLELVLVKAGEFMMGGHKKSTAVWQGNEGPIHKVTLTKSYYIGKYPVTVAQFTVFANATKYQSDCEKSGNRSYGAKDNKWSACTGVNWRGPGFEQTPNHPVVLVSWGDTQAFVAWATKQTGRDVRLPSEAQWEYAARGPNRLEYPFGETWDGLKVNHRDAALKKSGWLAGGCSNDNDGYVYTSPVGKFSNASWCGAFDMSGNVRQWVQDWAADYPNEAQVDPQGPTTGQKRIGRGSSWYDEPEFCRAAFRTLDHPDYVGAQYGFRVVVEPAKAR